MEISAPPGYPQHIVEAVKRIHETAVEKLSKMEIIRIHKARFDHLMKDLQVVFDNKLQVAAGKCRTKYKIEQSTIQLHARLFAKDISNLETTYIHELMHAVSSVIYQQRTGHGIHWQSFMLAMGQKPDRCHDMDVSAFRRKPTAISRYLYGCGCREIYLSAIRHRRVLNGRTYICTLCNQKFIATGVYGRIS